MSNPEKKLHAGERVIHEEGEEKDQNVVDERDLADVAGGGPGVRTVYGVRNGWIATTPERKPGEPRNDEGRDFH